MEITKILEFDAGHRLPNHKGGCKNIHGHRYKAEITFLGEILENNDSDNGMIVDFGDIKKYAKEIIDSIDHSFIVSSKDTEMIDFLKKQKSKTTILSDSPTSENLISFLFKKIEQKFKIKFKDTIKLTKIKLYETPNSFVEIIKN